MSNLKIYQLVDGVSLPFPNLDSQIEIFDYTYNAKRMGGAPSISATVKFETCLDDVWTDNIYVEFKGEKYFLKQTPTSSYSNDEARYKHELELVSERIILDNVYFYDVVSDQDEYKPVTNSSKVAFFGTIDEFAQRMNYSLQYAKLQTNVNGEIQGYLVIVDEGIESEGKLITFEDQYFSNVLQEIYNVYELPYYFIGKEIHIGFKDGDLSQTFQYGLTNELLSITKTNANALVVNRATGQGSADNIPYYYPNMSEKGDMKAVLHTTKDGVVVTEDVTIINGEKYGKLFNPTDDTLTVGESLTYHKKRGEMEYIANSYKYVISKEGVDSSDYSYTNNYIVRYPFQKGDTKTTFKFQRKIKVTEEGEFTISAAIYQYDTNGVFSNNTFNAGNVVNIQLKNIEIGETYHTYVEVVNSVAVGFKTNDVIPVGEYLFSFDYNVPYQGYITTGTNSYATKLILGDIVSPLKEYWHAEHADKNYMQLRDVGLRLQDGTTPNENDVIIQEKIGYIQPQGTLMPPIYRESEGDERFYNALNETYEDENGEYIDFPNPYVEGKPKEVIVEFSDIKPTIVGIKNKAGQEICKILDVAFDQDDNNETEEIDGTLEFKHPYFFVKLAKTDGEHPFNIFDSAIDEGEMTLAMTSGHCGGCEFTIMVSDDDLKMNTVQVDDNGNLVRDDKGNVLCGREPYQSSVVPQDRQNDTIENEVWIALKKDEQTFGRMMPEGNIKPVADDTFVLLHIFLPQAYIKYAEGRLEQELIKYIKDNNEEKFTFSIKFSRIYLAENPDVANAITENALLNVSYNGYTYPLYVSSYTYKVTSTEPLPEITVELKDEIAVNQNALQNAITEVKGDFLQTFKNIDIIGLATPYFLRKDINDRSEGKIAASLGFEAGGYAKGRSGAKIDEYGQAEFENITSRNGIITKSISTPDFVQGLAGGVGGKFWVGEDGKVNLEVDNLTARQSLTVMELIIQEVKSVGGELVVSASNGEIESITAHYTNGDYADGSNVADMTNVDHYTIKLKDDAVFMDGDLIRCSQWDMANNSLRSYWVQFYPQTDADGATGNTGIVYASDFASGIAPQVGDKLVQMGNVSNTERQGAIVISALNNKPYISVYDNISQPNIQIANLKGRFGDLSNLTINGKTLSGYGIWSNNAHFSGSYTTQDGHPIEDVIKDSVDNINIGGRNLLLGTNQGTANWRLASSIGTTNYTIRGVTYQNYKGVSFIRNSWDSTPTYEVLTFPLRSQMIEEGKTYHLSFDMLTASNPTHFTLAFATAVGGNVIFTPLSISNIGDGQYKHYDLEFTATTNGDDGITRYVYIATKPDYLGLWETINIVNLKLEEGTKATAWTPAPEDTDNNINEVKAIAEQAQADADANAAVTATLQGNIDDIYNRLDGVVENWFGEDVPTTENYPANEWTTDADKEAHLGDTYTNNQGFVDNETTPNAGKSWRWVKNDTNAFYWVEIADSDAVKALQAAAQAQDTADGKRRVFISTIDNPYPSIPYDEGDMWVTIENEATVIYVCTVSKSVGAFNKDDWRIAGTDDTALNNFISEDFEGYKTEVAAQFEVTSGNFTSIQSQVTTLELRDNQNLLIDSAKVIDDRDYLLGTYNLGKIKPPVEGELVTLSFSGYLGTGHGLFRICNSGYAVQITTLNRADYNATTKRYEKTFNWVAGDSDNTAMYIFQADEEGNMIEDYSDTAIVASRVYNIKLERSANPTAWSPAPEDTDNKISATETKLETKIEQTSNEITLSVSEEIDGIKTELEDTGINITNKTVTVTSNKFFVRNNEGDITMGVDAKGNLSVNAIACRQSAESNVAAENIADWNTKGDGVQRWYFDNGDIRAEVGWDAATESMIRMYDENGMLLWKIGNPAEFQTQYTEPIWRTIPLVGAYSTYTDCVNAVKNTENLQGTTYYRKTNASDDTNNTVYTSNVGTPLTPINDGWYTDSGLPFAFISGGMETDQLELLTNYTRNIYQYTNGKVAQTLKLTWTNI